MATKKQAGARSKQRAQPKQSPGARELLVLELQEIHNAEHQLARVTPRFIKAAEAEMLRAYLHRRSETGSQLIEELTSAFEELARDPGRRKNVAAEGLLNDLRNHIQEMAAGPARDAVLIAGAQKIEHYCVAAWGTARALAQALGIHSVIESMSRALDEGKDLDRQLTELAVGEILPELLADEDAEEALDNEEDEEDQVLGRSRRTSGSERRAPH